MSTVLHRVHRPPSSPAALEVANDEPGTSLFEVFLYPKSVKGLPKYMRGHELGLRWLGEAGWKGVVVGEDGSAVWTTPSVIHSNISMTKRVSGEGFVRDPKRLEIWSKWSPGQLFGVRPPHATIYLSALCDENGPFDLTLTLPLEFPSWKGAEITLKVVTMPVYGTISMGSSALAFLSEDGLRASTKQWQHDHSGSSCDSHPHGLSCRLEKMKHRFASVLRGNPHPPEDKASEPNRRCQSATDAKCPGKQQAASVDVSNGSLGRSPHRHLQLPHFRRLRFSTTNNDSDTSTGATDYLDTATHYCPPPRGYSSDPDMRVQS